MIKIKQFRKELFLNEINKFISKNNLEREDLITIAPGILFTTLWYYDGAVKKSKKKKMRDFNPYDLNKVSDLSKKIKKKS